MRKIIDKKIKEYRKLEEKYSNLILKHYFKGKRQTLESLLTEINSKIFKEGKENHEG